MKHSLDFVFSHHGNLKVYSGIVDAHQFAEWDVKHQMYNIIKFDSGERMAKSVIENGQLVSLELNIINRLLTTSEKVGTK